MILPLSNDIRIASDEHCWKLERKRTRSGKTCYEAFKWCTSMDSALHTAAQLELRTDPAHGIHEALVTLRRITEKYAKIFDDTGRHQPERLRAVS